MQRLAQLKKQMITRIGALYVVMLVVLLNQGNFTGVAHRLIFGTRMAVLNVYLLAGTLEKSVRINFHKARACVTFHYMLRYSLVFLVLLIAIKQADMDVLWPAAICLSPRLLFAG